MQQEVHPDSSPEQKALRRRRKRLIYTATLLFLLAVGATSYYYYYSLLPVRAQTAFHDGVIALAPNHYDEALRQLNRAMELQPDLKGIYLQRGIAYQNLGKIDLALDDFARALLENPKQPEVYTARAQIYRSRQDYPKALEELSRSLAIREDTDTFFERAQTYEILGDYPKAIADLDQVIKNLRDAPHALRLRGFLKQKIGDKTGAAEDFEQALTFEIRGLRGTRRVAR